MKGMRCVACGELIVGGFIDGDVFLRANQWSRPGRNWQRGHHKRKPLVGYYHSPPDAEPLGEGEQMVKRQGYWVIRPHRIWRRPYFPTGPARDPDARGSELVLIATQHGSGERQVQINDQLLRGQFFHQIGPPVRIECACCHAVHEYGASPPRPG